MDGLQWKKPIKMEDLGGKPTTFGNTDGEGITLPRCVRIIQWFEIIWRYTDFSHTLDIQVSHAPVSPRTWGWLGKGNPQIRTSWDGP